MFVVALMVNKSRTWLLIGFKQVARKTKKQYDEAGFKNIEFGFKPIKPVTCIFICGEK